MLAALRPVLLVHAKLNKFLSFSLKSKQNKKKVNIPNTEKFLEGSQKFGERLGFETNNRIVSEFYQELAAIHTVEALKSENKFKLAVISNIDDDLLLVLQELRH